MPFNSSLISIFGKRDLYTNTTVLIGRVRGATGIFLNEDQATSANIAAARAEIFERLSTNVEAFLLPLGATVPLTRFSETTEQNCECIEQFVAGGGQVVPGVVIPCPHIGNK